MKYQDLKKISKDERDKKLKELKIELAKSSNSKVGTSKNKEIRKIIARINMLNSQGGKK